MKPLLGLVDFLKASGVDVVANNLKVHLACNTGIEHPIDVYFAGNFKKWQEHQTKRNFQAAQVISLIDLGQGKWLFVGVYKILGCKPQPKFKKQFQYSTQLLPNQDALIGRAIVYHKRTRATYIWYRPPVVLPLIEIRQEKMSIGEFPGYNSVVLSHRRLKIVIDQKIESWHGALANIKGIYLITDTSTGKHYVGKASGEDGIWQRWCDYSKNGHGENVQLKKLLGENDENYNDNFQYSILEIAYTHASNEDILKRESYWVRVLKSREFGLN